MKKNSKLYIFYSLSLIISMGLFSNKSYASQYDMNKPYNTENSEGTGEVDGYRLIWQDLFEGEELNEEGNWDVEIDGNGNGNRELQYYRRENIEVGQEPESGNSCLIITAKKENYAGRPATSGRLTTQKKMSFKYGKIEARIKLPKTADGLWPAFWLLGDDFAEVNWPRCGEIDIMEMGHIDGIRDNTQDRFFNGACHWGYYEDGWYPNYANHYTNEYGMQDDFHLFTLIWDPVSIKMYLDKDKYPDRKPYYQMNITDQSTPKSVGHYFNKPYFVIFNLAVGGNFTGIWDINQITALAEGEAKMYVDFVKLYQKGDPDEEFSGIAVPDKNKIEEHNPGLYFDNMAGLVYMNEPISQISIFGINGSEIRKANDTTSIRTVGLQSGIYVVRAFTKDQKVHTMKIII